MRILFPVPLIPATSSKRKPPFPIYSIRLLCWHLINNHVLGTIDTYFHRRSSLDFVYSLHEHYFSGEYREFLCVIPRNLLPTDHLISIYVPLFGAFGPLAVCDKLLCCEKGLVNGSRTDVSSSSSSSPCDEGSRCTIRSLPVSSGQMSGDGPKQQVD